MMNSSSSKTAVKNLCETLGFRRAHLVGIGGCGMSAIAFGLMHHGVEVTGSDLSLSRYTERLTDFGAKIIKGHSAGNLGAAEALVVSSAIHDDNPELQAARERGLPIWHRAQVLGALLTPHRSVCVAGSHGKSTTTTMVGLALEACGFDPTVYVGGFVQAYNSNVRLGHGAFAAAESDESDGSFLRLPVDYAIVTNVEPEHLDYWVNNDRLIQGFRSFLEGVRPNGFALVSRDDEGAQTVRAGLRIPVLTYGTQSLTADFSARRIQLHPFGSTFEMLQEGRVLGPVELSVPGLHNVSNATAAIGLALRLGGDLEKIVAALRRFRGVGRRFQVIGEAEGVTVVDDYAHHPTEVAATLEAAQRVAKSRQGRLFGVFQPHRFSRTQHLGAQFGKSFVGCDCVVLTDIYAAGEAPIEGVSGAIVYDSVVAIGHPDAQYVPRCEDIPGELLPRLRPGDVVVTLGAGDIYRVGEKILSGLSGSTRTQNVASSTKSAAELLSC